MNYSDLEQRYNKLHNIYTKNSLRMKQIEDISSNRLFLAVVIRDNAPEGKRIDLPENKVLMGENGNRYILMEYTSEYARLYNMQLELQKDLKDLSDEMKKSLNQEKTSTNSGFVLKGNPYYNGPDIPTGEDKSEDILKNQTDDKETKRIIEMYENIQTKVNDDTVSLDKKLILIKRFKHEVLSLPSSFERGYAIFEGKRVFVPLKFKKHYALVNSLEKRLKNTSTKKEENTGVNKSIIPISRVFTKDNNSKGIIPIWKKKKDNKNKGIIPYKKRSIIPFKDDEYEKIESYTKPKKRKKLSARLKAIIAAIVAGVVMFFGTVAYTVSNWLHPTKSDSDNDIKVETILEEETLGTDGYSNSSNSTKKVVDSNSYDNGSKAKKSSKTENNPNFVDEDNYDVEDDHKFINYNDGYNDEEYIDIGDQVSFKDNNIYSNASDAYYGVNMKTPYYDNSSASSVVGIALKSGDSLATFVPLADDPSTYEAIVAGSKSYLTEKEAMKEISLLRGMGWKDASVAFRNNQATSGVTGYHGIKKLVKLFHK